MYLLKDLRGRPRKVSLSKYRVEWDEKCRSIFQYRVKQFFRKYWKNHICAEEFAVPGTKLSCDFLNFTLKISVESHGMHHESFTKNPFFHGYDRNKFLQSIKNDLQKVKWLELNGFKIVEIYENEIDLLSPEWINEKFGIELE